MVEMQSLRDKLVKVFDEMKFDAEGAPTTDMRLIEQASLGADHCAFGAALCEAWKFPKSFGHVAGHHHDPTKLPSGNRLLASVVHIADRLSAQLNYGFRGDIQNSTIDPHVCEEIGMSLPQLQTIKLSLPQIFEEVQATFG
jgi:HD-like signal output (HDOD) protein